jgi:hypothetical protein
MLSLNNDFLGYHPLEHNVMFSGSDTVEIYENNLKTKPIDWYYRTNQISYVRNNNGHRCKNIEDIDLDNYILTIGCSHTEGIGLKLEDTYPYMLSQKMNCDYYNLGIGGIGIDILNYNLVTWFSKIKKLPKLLVVQWPHISRITLENYPKLNSDTTPYIPHGTWSSDHKELGAFLVLGDKINFFNTGRNLTKRLIHNVADCPIIELSTSYDNFDQVDLRLTQVDYARDHSNKQVYGHMGVESQKINTESIFNLSKNVSIS